MHGNRAADQALSDVNGPDGEIALCTLSAFNLGALETLDELEGLADLAVRALDALLDYQGCPIPARTARSIPRSRRCASRTCAWKSRCRPRR